MGNHLGMKNDFSCLRAGNSCLSGCKSDKQEGGSKGGRLSPLWQDGTWRGCPGRRPGGLGMCYLASIRGGVPDGDEDEGEKRGLGNRLLFSGRKRIRNLKRRLEVSEWLAVRSNRMSQRMSQRICRRMWIALYGGWKGGWAK